MCPAYAARFPFHGRSRESSGTDGHDGADLEAIADGETSGDEDGDAESNDDVRFQSSTQSRTEPEGTRTGTATVLSDHTASMSDDEVASMLTHMASTPPNQTASASVPPLAVSRAQDTASTSASAASLPPASAPLALSSSTPQSRSPPRASSSPPSPPPPPPLGLGFTVSEGVVVVTSSFRTAARDHSETGRRLTSQPEHYVSFLRSVACCLPGARSFRTITNICRHKFTPLCPLTARLADAVRLNTRISPRIKTYTNPDLAF